MKEWENKGNGMEWCLIQEILAAEMEEGGTINFEHRLAIIIGKINLSAIMGAATCPLIPTWYDVTLVTISLLANANNAMWPWLRNKYSKNI